MKLEKKIILKTWVNWPFGTKKIQTDLLRQKNWPFGHVRKGSVSNDVLHLAFGHLMKTDLLGKILVTVFRGELTYNYILDGKIRLSEHKCYYLIKLCLSNAQDVSMDFKFLKSNTHYQTLISFLQTALCSFSENGKYAAGKKYSECLCYIRFTKDNKIAFHTLASGNQPKKWFQVLVMCIRIACALQSPFLRIFNKRVDYWDNHISFSH